MERLLAMLNVSPCWIILWPYRRLGDADLMFSIPWFPGINEKDGGYGIDSSYRYGIVQFNYSEDCRKKAWALRQGFH